MRQLTGLSLSLLLAACAHSAPAQDSASDGYTGYVTSVASPTAFDLNTRHIVVTPQTTIFGKGSNRSLSPDERAAQPIILGEYLTIAGEYDRHTRTMKAATINIRGDASGHITGTALLDRVIATRPQQLLRCDGYILVMTPKTKLIFTPPYTAEPEHPVGSWLIYSGERQQDGTILADQLTFSVGDPSDSELHYDSKSEKSVTAPDYEANKPGRFKVFGIDAAIPADRAVQQRVSSIGARLVPAFQKDLQEKSPARFDFRFYAIDDKHIRAGLNTPDGTVLIPIQMLNRLQNDDQVAAILADGIANVLEREVYRSRGARGAAMGAAIATSGGLLMIGALAEEKHILRKMEEQRGRVSLGLMQDAGFDVTQAPIAWRLMAPKKPEPIDKISLPEHSGYLLGIIGSEYSAGRPAASPAPIGTN